MNPTVSVIIPAYNAENSLTACIASVLGQTFKPYEVLVINDGSSDRTGEIAKRYGDKIIYIEQENQGQGAARNKGLKRAHGEFIAFLDADDYWRKDFLEHTVTFLEEHQEAIAVSTALVIQYADGGEKIMPACLQNQEKFDRPIILENFFKFWAEQDHVRTGSNLIRKSVIDQAGGQRADLRISQDLEYWGYIATFGKWGFIPEPLWVGCSRTAAIGPGWLKKYKQRRKLCPTVESWEKRIVPRLKSEDIHGFEIVRGRVAASYAHNKILAGDLNGALDIIKKYSASMPRNQLKSPRL
jgi:glycosyltransferase involved in cell wall biosynthesis